MRCMEKGFQEYFFDRVDEGDDALFYSEPRLVVHIDQEAIAQIGRIFQELLPANGTLLDLMSSWRSHLPADFAKERIIGLGLNAVEMRENPDLDEHVVHDVNKDPELPFVTDSFDAVILTVSAQYLTRPVEVFREVNRVLKPGGPLVVTFSNRMFPTKAVRIWQACQRRAANDPGQAIFSEGGRIRGDYRRRPQSSPRVPLRPGLPGHGEERPQSATGPSCVLVKIIATY